MISSSFIQDQKHGTKTDRFVAVQPAQIATVLKDYGFDLVHLKTGQARRLDRESHQTTIARYRSPDALKIEGLHLDLVFKVPHLYGAIEAFLGTFRQVCSNGLTVGTKFYQAPRIRHTGDALSTLNTTIMNLVAQNDALTDQIKIMSAKDVTPSQVAEFVHEVAQLRLAGTENLVSVNYSDLMSVRRGADMGKDAFSVLNVVQENVMRFGMRYQTETTDSKTGIKSVRNMNARPVMRRAQGEIETIKSVDLNASIWDAASNILMAG